MISVVARILPTESDTDKLGQVSVMEQQNGLLGDQPSGTGNYSIAYRPDNHPLAAYARLSGVLQIIRKTV